MKSYLSPDPHRVFEGLRVNVDIAISRGEAPHFEVFQPRAGVGAPGLPVDVMTARDLPSPRLPRFADVLDARKVIPDPPRGPDHHNWLPEFGGMDLKRWSLTTQPVLVDQRLGISPASELLNFANSFSRGYDEAARQAIESRTVREDFLFRAPPDIPSAGFAKPDNFATDSSGNVRAVGNGFKADPQLPHVLHVLARPINRNKIVRSIERTVRCQLLLVERIATLAGLAAASSQIANFVAVWLVLG